MGKRTLKKLCALITVCLFAGGVLGQNTNTCIGILTEESPEEFPSIESTSALNCSNSSAVYTNYYRYQQSYIPDAATPVKTIAIAFHIIQKSDGTGNYQNNPTDISKINSIADFMSEHFFNRNDAPSHPIPGVSHISDTKFRVEVEHIYFYQDDNLHQPITNSSLRNNLLNAAYNQHPECLETINIFLLGDKANGYGYTVPSSSDIYIITAGGGYDLGGEWGLAQHLTHEMGHDLGLCHTSGAPSCMETLVQTNIDYLSDVFNGGGYYNASSNGGDLWGCDPFATGATCSNNMMGGTFQAGNFSPLQMGRMHRMSHFHNVRKYITGYSSTPLEITSNETWDFNTKLYSDLVVKNGAT